MLKLYTQRLITLLILLSLANALSAQCPITVSAGEDILLCQPPTPTQLDGEINGDYLNFSWSPTTGLTGINSLNPTVNVTQNMTYVLRAKAVDNNINLINNGDFEGGNFGFTSDYTYSPGDLWPEGVYEVGDNPQSSHSNFAACGDHTSGSGQMMIVNGNGTPNTDVWCQTVTVQPNTEYAFTAWGASVISASPAVLQFSVNGTNIGTTFALSSATCNWQQFYAIWNSGGNTSASICVVNQNTALSGNDFALDDIGFSPVCTVTDTVKVTIAPVVAVASPVVLVQPCDGTNMTLNGTGSSTGPGYSYAWETANGNIVSGANTLNPVVNEPGTYVLTVTYTQGATECTKTASVNVIPSPAPLSAWITPPQPLGCGGNTTLLIANSTQGAVSYAWSTTNGTIVSGQNAKTCSVSQVGTYTVVVTSLATGCTATAEVTVTSATNPPTSNATTVQTITCTQALAALSGTGSSTGNNITYAWSVLAGSGGTLTGPTNTLNATASAPGSFVLAVTNTSNNCIAYDTVAVTGNLALPNLAIAPADTLNCVRDTVHILANITPTNSSIAWSTANGVIVGPTNTSALQVIANGTYQLVATHPTSGCTSTQTVTVTTDTQPPTALALPADSITCQQISVVLSGAGSSANGPFTYQWQGPNVVQNGQTLSPTVNAAGTYTLLVTNTNNGCTATATTIVHADANAITAVANAPDTLDCVTNTVVLNTNGSTNGTGFLYQWTTTNGQITLGAQTPTPTVTQSGTYTLLLTNPANGCTSTAVATVLSNTTPPNFTIAAPAPLTCAQPTTALSVQVTPANGQYTYQWATANGQIQSGQQSATPVVTQAGNYQVTVTQLQNGCTATASTAVISTDQLPVLAIAAPPVLNCNLANTNLQLTINSVTGTPQIAWATPNGQILNGNTTANPLVNAAGNYAVTVTNPSNGCSSTATIAVQMDTLSPAFGLPVPTVLTCAQATQVLTANIQTAGANTIWSTANGHFVNPPSGSTATVDQAGTYQLLVTNPANGCTQTGSVTVAANQTLPVVNIPAPNTLTCIQTNVPLNAQITQVGPNFTTTWTTTNGTFSLPTQAPATAVSAPGNYQVSVTNTDNGCTATATVAVAQNITPPTVAIASAATLTCAQPTFTLTGTVSNGTATWSTANGHFSNGIGSLTPTVDAPGTYLLAATNAANGCTATQTVNIQQNTTPPVANAGNDGIFLCSTNTLTLNGSTSNEPNLAIQWTASQPNAFVDSSTVATPAVQLPGTYILQVTNPVNGCVDRDTVVMAADVNQPVVNMATPAILTCTTTSVPLNATATSPNPNLNIQWSTSNGVLGGNTNSLQATAQGPGTYTLLVTDPNNGCTTQATVSVQQNIQPPVAEAGTAGTLTCTTTSLNLGGSSNLGVSATYAWSTTNGFIVAGQNATSPLINAPGTYTLVVTNPQNGCTHSDQVTVAQNTVAPVAQIAAPALLTCTQNTATLSASSQPAAVNAVWTTTNGHLVSGQNTLAPTLDQPGTYVLLVTNPQNGCTDTEQVLVNQNIVPPVIDAGAVATLNCNITQLQLTGTATGSGTAPVNIVWSSNNGNIISGGTTLQPQINRAGTYTITGTDPFNGCTAQDAVTIGIDTVSPVLTIAAPQLLTCARQQVTLSATALQVGANMVLQWTTAQGNFVNGQNTLQPIVDAPAQYALSVTNPNNGCHTQTVVNVGEDIQPPVADAGQDGLLHCNQNTLGLQANATQVSGTPQYQWSTTTGSISGNAQTANVTALTAGVYQLLVTNPVNGCTDTDEVQIAALPLPDFTPTAQQPDCLQPLGMLSFGAVQGGAEPFTFSFDGGNTFVTMPEKGGLAPKTYTLVVEDSYGCTAEADITLNEPQYPGVALAGLYEIEQGDSVQLVPQLTYGNPNQYTWAWQTNTPDASTASLSCVDCPKPWVTPLLNATYTVTVTNALGCTATAQTNIKVDTRRYIYAPNIIFPDGDAPNHRFTLFGRGVTEIEVLEVYDRWGAMLWQGQHLAPNDVDAGWDGKRDDRSFGPAVFVWKAVVVFPDGKKEVYAGDVTVVR